MGAGKSTWLRALADRLQLAGAQCVDASRARQLDATGVAVIDGEPPADVAGQLVRLVRNGWRVLAAVRGPSASVERALGPLVRARRAVLVAMPALDHDVRAELLRRELPSSSADARSLLAECAPSDGRAVRVLAARAVAHAVLAGGAVDVDVAESAVRGGLARRGAPPVPVPFGIRRDLDPAAISVARRLVGRVQPLARLGELGAAIAGVTPDAPVLVSGGQRAGVAHRAALDHALEGHAVLLVSVHERHGRVFDRILELAGGADDPIAHGMLDRCRLAVLADPAVPPSALGALLPRIRPHVGFSPDVVVVDGHHLDPTGLPVRHVVVGDPGAAGAQWEVDDGDPALSVRRAGGPWRTTRAAPRSAAPEGLTTDDTGAVVAWRLWSLVIDAEGVALGSPVRSTVWPRGVLTSSCPQCGTTPGSHCRCGIYAFAEAKHALAVWRREPQLVFGELRCWGRIVHHDLGIRAEHAQPVCLHLGSVGAEAERVALSARYGCDVVGR